MPLTIVNVAYPLAPVSADAVGGAEQILYTLDEGLVAAGHRSIVVACEGSRTVGELVSTPAPPQRFDARVHTAAAARHRRVLAAVLARCSVDVVHLHGHDFDMYLPPEGVPTLATLHLPPELLIAHPGEIARPHTWVNGVSWAQHGRLPPSWRLLPPIENGVDVDALPRGTRRRDFVLMLGRVCHEKGIHLGLEAARLAKVPLLVGGLLFPYDEHQRYFEREVLPRLGRDRRFVGPVTRARKRWLLSAARCLLVPSLAQETSSLVAMEALACGTPVVAFASGTLPDVVDHGLTGFIVRDVDQMAAAIHEARTIPAERCRAAARARFPARRMVERYLERYEQILSWSRSDDIANTARRSSA